MRRLAAAWCAALAASAGAAETVTVGSKRFTESYILKEVLRETAAGAGAAARHRQGLGNTGIVFAALQAGEIDLYPEYTGTVAREILKLEGGASLDEINRRLAPLGLGAAVPLGFNNNYALAMREAEAARLGVRTISDLARHPGLRLGFTQEFLGRADGWPGLKRAYALPFAAPTGIDHGLGYEALAAGRIDVKDVYSTDAKIARYGLRVLEDDRGFFPRYDAVLLYRLDLARRAPSVWGALAGLEGRIDEATMMRLNAAAELDGRIFAQAAAMLAGGDLASGAAAPRFLDRLFGPDFWRLTVEHVVLVTVSLAAAVLLGVPFGLLAAKVPGLAPPVLAAAGLIQTIPSLALLALLIAALGRIGTVPALLALFLYALLPIVRNTHAGLVQVPRGLRDAAVALGLSARDRVTAVELPLALPTILAGVKTSAVINVGTATIAAFVGAGGYGERIVQGLALNDGALLVAGALPAAALALLVQSAFDLLESRCGLARRAPRS